MQTILGPFHPFLESALVDEIVKYKDREPLCPLLVLVPSTALRRHLQFVLGRSRRLSLLNVHLMTFFQLSHRLYAEAHGEPHELREDLFFEEIVRYLLRARGPGAESFAGLVDRAGGCAALWQTLRDLRDGWIDPQLALEALGKDRARRASGAQNTELLLLWQSFLSFCREKAVFSPSDLDKQAVELAPNSPFLQQFAQLFYYGFYDLTQIQLDFFHAVAKQHPTTLLFPLLPPHPSHGAWIFAERFYERYAQGYNRAPARELPEAGETALPAIFKLFDEHNERPYAKPSKNWHCTILNTFGLQDEVAAAAKEILRLVEDDGVAFNDIAVVARTLDGYGAAIQEIFRGHRIPIDAAIEEPLVEFPLAKAVILLFNLRPKDFLRSPVIDLLSSPHFKFPDSSADDGEPRADLWDLASRELAICRGVTEWRRLRNYFHRDIFLAQLSHDDEPRFLRIAAAQVRRLAETVEHLAGDLLELPESASWSDYARRWRGLLEKYLGLSADENSPASAAEDPPRKRILALLEQMAALDVVNDQVSLTEFGQTFEHWLERSTLHGGAQAQGGVRVLSATAARGLSFRALFMLGLNEGIFPRTIREDAFLRDSERTLLETTLGNKINPKLAAFDEEKLLFALLAGAARERLYCSFQRADDAGRALAPSWYLAELKRSLKSYEGKHLTETTIPRRALAKAQKPPFDRESLLVPEELALRWSLEARDPSALIERFSPSPTLYMRGRKIAAELDKGGERLGGYDGIVGPLPEYWRRTFERGLSPTALEIYARCPFQFFARQLLGLERLDRPEEISGPGPAELGDVGHALLYAVYRELIDRGYFESKTRTIDLDPLLAAAAAGVFKRYETENPVGYALPWAICKENLTRWIAQVITLDMRELAASGFVPIGLETSARAELPADWPQPLAGAAIHGRMDRIDRHTQTGALRIIDYKFKFGSAPSPPDKNLHRAALRGERLQPPFYSLLGARWAHESLGTPAAPVEAQFCYIAPHWSGGPLASAAFPSAELAGKLGVEIKRTVAALADGIRRGLFFINKGAHCDHCEVAEICRKNHPPSLWRAERDPLTAPLRALKEKDPRKL